MMLGFDFKGGLCIEFVFELGIVICDEFDWVKIVIENCINVLGVVEFIVIVLGGKCVVVEILGVMFVV